MDLSFREKSLWVVGATLAASFALYFAVAFPLPAASADVGPAHVGLFVAAVVLLVIAQVVGHVLVAIVDRDRDDDTDERDRLIALKGSRNGSYVLATGVFAALCTAAVTRGNFLAAHVLLASWVIAQLVEIGSQLWHYRRGA